MLKKIIYISNFLSALFFLLVSKIKKIYNIINQAKFIIKKNFFDYKIHIEIR